MTTSRFASFKNFELMTMNLDRALNKDDMAVSVEYKVAVNPSKSKVLAAITAAIKTRRRAINSSKGSAVSKRYRIDQSTDAIKKSYIAKYPKYKDDINAV